MEIKKAYSTHEIERSPKNFRLFLARNRHGLEAILYPTFYYAELNTRILFFIFFFGKPTNDSLAVFTVHELSRIGACKDRNPTLWN